MTTQVDYSSRIMVALDYSSVGPAEQLLEQLSGTGCYVKVGMELFYAAGPAFVADLKRRGYRIFLDLKMHDIPNTVKGGSRSLAGLGVDLFNVHAAGGRAMMEAAREGVEQGISSGQQRPLIIGVTQLTSTSQTVFNDEIGLPGSLEQGVLNYARLSKLAGLDGVVASPHEVIAIKATCGSDFVTVTPGIRPKGADIGDQSRVMTPQDAFGQGTDFIVVGRAITAAADPREAFESIVKEIG